MENENYATKEFPLRIETMCVRNPFDAHNPIYHPYHNTSNFVSVEEFYERYKKDNMQLVLYLAPAENTGSFLSFINKTA